jgi:hypothetical protein
MWVAPFAHEISFRIFIPLPVTRQPFGSSRGSPLVNPARRAGRQSPAICRQHRKTRKPADHAIMRTGMVNGL